MMTYLLTQVLYIAPAVVGLILIGARARGSARMLGVIGCIVWLVFQTVAALWGWLLPDIMDALGLSVGLAGIPSAVIALFSAVGFVLVVFAVVAGRRSASSMPPVPGPYGPPQQPPMQQAGYQQPGSQGPSSPPGTR